MYDERLGKLTKLNVRKMWPHEAKDFTPWLSDNLEQLTSVLGFQLESPEVEKAAGPYKADILAQCAQDRRLTVIENQLARADLQHLGQLVAYISELGTFYGVWVATGFNRTILNAIRMLNRRSPERFGLFAVKLGLFGSNSGRLVPLFDVVEHPKLWVDPIAQGFWESSFPPCQPSPVPIFDSGSTMRRRRYLIDEARLTVTQFFGASFVRVYITGSRNEPDNKVFPRIGQFRKSLMAEFDKSELLAGPNPRFTTQFQVNSRQRRNWNCMADWLENQRMRYERVLRNSLKNEH